MNITKLNLKDGTTLKDSHMKIIDDNFENLDEKKADKSEISELSSEIKENSGGIMLVETLPEINERKSKILYLQILK